MSSSICGSAPRRSRTAFGVELTARNHAALYVPQGFAHGFQSLADDTEVFYQMSQAHAPQAAAGFRWNDPAFGIEWPLDVSVISPRDRSFPDFRPDRPLQETSS